MAFQTGIPATFLVPRFIAKLIFAAGVVSAASGSLACLLVGMKTSGGSMVADQDIVRCQSVEEADSYSGNGSQLARMSYSALTVPGIELWIAAVTEPVAGTAATATLAITGPATANGTLRFRVAGKTYTAGITSGDTATIVGDTVAAAINADSRSPVTAVNVTGTVAFTCRNKGAQSKDWIIYLDKSENATGVGYVLTGSAAQNVDGVRMGAAASGTGSEDVTTLLTKLQAKRYARIALGHNDAVNAALWETHVNTKAGPLSLLLEHLVFAHNGSQAQVTSLAQTTLNAPRASVMWLRNSESHPCEIAAWVAAYRSAVENSEPLFDWDGFEVTPAAPQAFDGDVPTLTEQNTVLNAGVTPLTTVNGKVQIVRMITSYCKNGANADTRCLDIGDAVVPDYVCVDLQFYYSTGFRPANPLVGPDPAPEDEPPPPGVAFPRAWNSKLVSKMQGYFRAGLLELPPTLGGVAYPASTYIAANKAIASEIPIYVRRLQHRIDLVIRQTAS